MSGLVPRNALFVCFGYLPNMGTLTESAAGGSIETA